MYKNIRQYFQSGICVGLSSLTSLTANSITPNILDFDNHIVPILEKYCMGCHDEETRKGKFSMEKLNPDMLHGDNLEQWRLVEEQVFFGDMPPENKKQLSSDDRKTLLQWLRTESLKTQRPDFIASNKLHLPQYGNYVDHEALFTKPLPRVYPAPPRIWRLRPSIYNSAMPRLGEKITGLANGLNMHEGSEIKDYSSNYFLDEAATAPLLDNAKKIAQQLTGPFSKDRTFKELVNPEKEPTPQLVSDTIELAFRKILGRSPTSEEKQRFHAFHAEASKVGGHIPAGKALISAVLLQPEVLYRQELGDGKPDQFGRVRLTPVETAYALSYALNNLPIPNFLEAANKGTLSTSEQVKELVTQQLQDESLLQEKNTRILTFFREYFHYPFAKEVFKDQPDGGKHDPNLLISDLETTIRDILREDKNVLKELLTIRKYYINTHYKLDKDRVVKLMKTQDRAFPYHAVFNLPHDWKYNLDDQPIEFPKEERAGVLTHPAWLAAWSGNFENHPVQRGKWIRTHLLGGTVPDVPIGVDARVPEKEHTSFRDRLLEATQAAECQRCHKKMDPLGLPFERYDHYGRLQRLDAGQPVDSTGYVDRTPFPDVHGEFDSPIDMIDHLANSKHVEQVFIRYVFRFFMGRNETLGDANTLQDAYKAYKDSHGSFRTLVASILSSDSFLLRQTKPNQAAE